MNTTPLPTPTTFDDFPVSFDRQKGKFIILVDASSLKMTDCFLKYVLACIYGYRQEKMSSDMEYGTAVHKAIETWMKNTRGGEVPATIANSQALVEAQKYFASTPMTVKDKKQYLNVGHLTGTCSNFMARGHKELLDVWKPVLSPVTGEPLVELKFKIPYAVHSCPLAEFYLSGTLDGLYEARKNPGLVAIGDIKTTSARDPEEYFNSYRLSHQLMMYTLALQYYRDIPDDDPDSFWKSTLQGKTLGAFIFGVFLQPPSRGGVETPAVFKLSRLFQYFDDEMNEFKAMLHAHVTRVANFIVDWQRQWSIDGCLRTRPLREGIMSGSCQTAFGSMCQFWNSCCMTDENARWGALETNFIKKFYNPAEFGGGKQTKP